MISAVLLFFLFLIIGLILINLPSMYLFVVVFSMVLTMLSRYLYLLHEINKKL